MDGSSHFNNQHDFPSVTLASIARDAFFFSPDALEFEGREDEGIQIVSLCYQVLGAGLGGVSFSAHTVTLRGTSRFGHEQGCASSPLDQLSLGISKFLRPHCFQCSAGTVIDFWDSGSNPAFIKFTVLWRAMCDQSHNRVKDVLYSKCTFRSREFDYLYSW